MAASRQNEHTITMSPEEWRILSIIAEAEARSVSSLIRITMKRAVIRPYVEQQRAKGGEEVES